MPPQLPPEMEAFLDRLGVTPEEADQMFRDRTVLTLIISLVVPNDSDPDIDTVDLLDESTWQHCARANRRCPFASMNFCTA